ncbi:diaminopimelate epimerase [Pseudonocardia ammonioxydans]|uniref:Diaminopimelate epimerase n=1 Tax=Pseudonocardia ammonioxydans TaxID=260086 RepID=A0A1I4TJL4_PSUAM|nr:diaminopimelate epimerase [Pseudonocardia ammonioxydans]SFM76914.1 diaminopimelate epimerase [Pseudonocardia ammonioxydans]
MSTGGIEFTKGHGTQNDFVVLPDPDAALQLTPERVAALCDRHRGLGADGVLRVVRWAKLAGDESVPEPVEGVEWFMDYRNADGSVAEMCGNGVRVFARYLHDRGWAPGGGAIGTRAGVRTATISGDTVSVDMGPVAIGAASVATSGDARFDGVALDVGNPHLACVIAADPDALDLTRAPSYDRRVFPHGVNVEFVTPLQGPADGGTVRMRVHERGVGETRACGTGTVAAVVAALRSAGHDAGDVHVATPGGRLRVTVEAGDGGSTGPTVLHGPAVLLATGELDRAWWEAPA